MSKINQSGRTMLEMMSVIALMGVLGVGGLQLYASAMDSVRADSILKEVFVRAEQTKSNADIAHMGRAQKSDGTAKKTVFLPDYKGADGGNTTVGAYGYQYTISNTDGLSVSINNLAPRICQTLKGKLNIYNGVVRNEQSGLVLSKILVCEAEGNAPCITDATDIMTTDCPTEADTYTATFVFDEVGASPRGGAPEDYHTHADSCPEHSSKEGTGARTNARDCFCEPPFGYWDGSKCTCSSGLTECGGECYPPCDGMGQTGERDPNTCGCKCAAGTDASTCQCPSGYIYSNGQCQRVHCVQGEGGKYKCYINGKYCGYMCNNTEMKQNSCNGYCSAEFCPEGTTWGSIAIGWSGLGCYEDGSKEDADFDVAGIYCGTSGYGSSWLCTQNRTTGTVCCSGTNFGKCTQGTCNPSDCNQFKTGGMTAEYAYVSDRKYGCKITKGGTSIYCYPSNGEWQCKKSSSNSEAVASCGLCSATDLINGTCGGDCFDTSKNCDEWKKTDPTVRWDADLQACVGKGSEQPDGQTYTCKLDASCYIGKGTEKRCAVGCNSITPDSCTTYGGLCKQDYCPAGTEYFYNKALNYGGCKRTLDDNKGFLFYRPGAWSNYPCYFGKTSETMTSLCGYNCNGNKDCSDCAIPIRVECTQLNCRTDGQLVNGCTCTGSASNGHCCPPGHVYIHGACSIVTVEEGKCLTDSGFPVDVTTDYVADASGMCQCVDSNQCMQITGRTPECIDLDETLEKNAAGLCQEKIL